MASFNEHYTTNRNTFRQQAEESFNQAAAANQAATDQYLADIDEIYKENARQLEQAYNQQKAQLPQDYQYAYDKNAIQQAINEREVAGRMEQLGLTDSGLNRTQQAAINVQRSNADAAVTQQQNAQLNALSSALAEQLSQNRANQTAGAAQARYDLASRNQDLYNSYMSNADSMAASIASSLYSADQQRAAAEAQAAAEQRQAYYDYLLESQKAQSQNGGTSGMSYQDISDLAMELAKADAAAYKIPSGQSVYDVYNTYLGQLAGAMGNTANTASGYAGVLSTVQDMLKSGKNSAAQSAAKGAYPLNPNNVFAAGESAFSDALALRTSIANYLGSKVSDGTITEDEATRIINSLNLG